MQVLVTKWPITEKVIYSLASHHRAKLSRTSIRCHSNWRILLPIGDNVDETRSGNYSNKMPRDIAFRVRSSCRLNRLNDRHVLLGGLSKRVTEVWIAAWKGDLCLQNDLRDSGLRARGRKLWRRNRWTDEDGVCMFYQAGFSKTVSGEEECGTSDKLYDAILVLAGGQVAGGGVPVWVERRLDKALDLQRSNAGGLCKIVCLGGGTPHKAPILSSDGFVVHESSSCAEYLHSRGAPYSHVIKEWGSYDTIGNGYFSLTQHVIPRRWRTLAVVTSEFHMPRARAIFEWIFGLQGAGLALQVGKLGFDGVVPGTGSEAQGFQLEFHSVPDNDVMEESIVQARVEKERRSIENLNIVMQRIHNLEDFHEWFHTEHKAYNAEHQHFFGREEKLDPALLSY